MIRSVKEAGQVLLSVAAGAALSFGAVLASSTPEEAASLTCSGYPTCHSRCVADGYSYGKCLYGECVCY